MKLVIGNGLMSNSVVGLITNGSFYDILINIVSTACAYPSRINYPKAKDELYQPINLIVREIDINVKYRTRPKRRKS